MKILGENLSVYVYKAFKLRSKFLIQAHCPCQYLIKHIVVSLLAFLLIGIIIVCTVRW